MSILTDIFHRIFENFDANAVIAERAAADPNKAGLDWRHSIVDLLKVLDLPSDANARHELAHELGYSGDVNSADMNNWLHGKVMEEVRKRGEFSS